jgi:hypothetical protein
VPQDGQAKQDCEIAAAKRWLAAHAQRYATGNVTFLGDDLYAHQPFCRQVLLHSFHFPFNCKPTSHSHLSGWVEALARSVRPTLKLRVKGKGNRWEHHQYRWANDVPSTDSDDALKVNWCELTILILVLVRFGRLARLTVVARSVSILNATIVQFVEALRTPAIPLATPTFGVLTEAKTRLGSIDNRLCAMPCRSEAIDLLFQIPSEDAD